MRIEELMNQHYEKLSDIDRSICSYLLNHRDACAGLTIEEFSKRCNVSPATLCRFAQKLSLPGFGELKAMLRLESKEAPAPDTKLLHTVIGSYHKMIEEIRQRDCTALFDLIYRSRRILAYGSGYAQARVASEFKRIFLPVQKTIYHMHGTDMAAPLAKLAEEKDLVFIISLSGESKPSLQLAEALRLRRIPTVSITRMRRNSLSELCTENFYIHSISIPTDYEIDYEISTPYFILIELLFLKYQAYLSAL